MTCLMPSDREMWQKAAGIDSLDNLGTDIYWVNNDKDVNEMVPLISELENSCKQAGKIHHQWLQCWGVQKGREQRILEQGKILVQAKPDALYVWAWNGQIGTTESCDDPVKSWCYAGEILKMAQNI